jgi:hypothetical protein
MAVRKLKKSHRNVTGRFFSTLLNRLVQFDSLLERDFILLLDMHPAVRWFAEQPLKILVHREADATQFYIPDFLITFHRGDFLGWTTCKPWIVETKYRSDLKTDWAKIRPKIRAGVREARKRDAQFRIITESRIAAVDLANARFLRPYLNAAVPPNAVQSVVRVAQSGRTTIADLASEVVASGHNPGQADQAIWVAVAKRLIAAEFDKPFGSQTVVWVR